MAERVTREIAEAVVLPDSAKARVTRDIAEAVVLPDSAKARVTRDIAEAVVSPTSGRAIVTRAVVEVVISNTQQFSFTADSVLKRNQTGSFTADAKISFPAVVSSFTADALLRALRSGSFTADAVISSFTTVSASFTADAYLVRRTTSSFTADSVLKGSQATSFIARAWIKSGTTGVTGEDGVRIKVGGVDVTDDVIFSDATFTMQVNGAPGQFRFRVRDRFHSHEFTSGAEVTLDIEGVRKFGGYLMMPHRGYAFMVDDTTNVSRVARIWTLTGVDYNILFTKRIVYDKASPANINLRSWPAGSRDDVIIKYVFDHYTDLSDDGATYDGVTHIGSPNPDFAGVVASGSLSFGDAMREINRLLSGVFYFDPYKDLAFVDVDTVDAENGLSDVPSPGVSSGYREFERIENGTGLVNDAMVWGAASGSDRIAYARVQSTASQSAHGLWQFGEFSSQLYKQSSVNRRADSIVNGSAQSKRGGKDDQVSWSLVTYDTSFSVGQKVALASEVWGVSDVVPIRKMTITFPTKTQPKLSLVLSHEIDEPWNLFEFYFPRFQLPTPIFIPHTVPFDLQQRHWYFGTLTYLSDRYGIASWTDDPSPINSTLYSSNTIGVRTPAGDYNFAFGQIGVAGDSLSQMGLAVAGGSYVHLHLPRPGDTPVIGGQYTPATIGQTGTFNVPVGNADVDTVVWAKAELTANGHVPHTVNLTWWIDPVGWDLGTPSPGQEVINDYNNTGDGVTTSFFTTFPYEPGSLVVTVDGTPVAVTETDPTTGEFTFAVAPADGTQIVAFYTAAGTAVEETFDHGSFREDLTGTGTGVQLISAYVPGSTQVFVDGYFQIPGTDYTESSPSTGQLTLAVSASGSQIVTVFYEANGLL